MFSTWIQCISLLAQTTSAFNHLVDPCKLICHMENSVDLCKLVSADGTTCRNAFWVDENQDSMIVDIVVEDDAIPVSVEDAIAILRAPKGGCEKLCKSHDSCIETGSNCKENDTCLNLFWNRGRPVPGNMTTCHSLDSAVDCPDVTPVLCGRFGDVKSLTADSTGVVQTDASNHMDNNSTSQESTRDSEIRVTHALHFLLLASAILTTLF